MNATTPRIGKSDAELFKREPTVSPDISHTVRLRPSLNEKAAAKAKEHFRYFNDYVTALIERDVAGPEAPNCVTCPHHIAVRSLAAALAKTSMTI